MKKVYSLFLFVVAASLLVSCDNRGIEEERARLADIEKRLIESMSIGDTNSAKVLSLQLTWDFVATTVGGSSQCEKYEELWTKKRISYMTYLNMDSQVLQSTIDTTQTFQVMDVIDKILD